MAAKAWTVEQVRSLILQRFGVSYSASHVAHIVRERGLASWVWNTHEAISGRLPYMPV
ncbi:winged helix-turn-helix domain-containing protein [Paraburkholderia sp. RL17-373-BIF-A]|uniref:winged helix-turn-helix domain-containing protein n=1 Tax=Paraburkholderia sp. RL17-373-BIF-A TaxID=3031629 RepID=UPI0038BB3C05